MFIHNSEKSRFCKLLHIMNSQGRISPEVLSLYCVAPTREATRDLSRRLQNVPELQHLEAIHRLKPNNGLRDLTAPWRTNPQFAREFSLLVSLETVNPEFRSKYPIPNLTLQAGSIEEGESALDAAQRELFEEAHVVVREVIQPPVGLLGGGMLMYCTFVTAETPLKLVDNVLYVG